MNLGLAGQSVERIVVDFGVTLVTDDGAEVRIETALALRTANGHRVVIDPEQPSDVGALLPAILHAMITEATANDSNGSLSLKFANGAAVDVSPSDDYEAWTYASRDGIRAIARPGGGLSAWSAE